MPDISKINNVAVADISKLDAVTFADGQKVNNQSVSLITDAHTLISTHTVPGDYSGPICEIDITSGIDSTYDVYEFHFYNIHASDDDAELMFQVNDSGDEGGAYDESPIVSTFFSAYNNESGGTPAVAYHTGHDTPNEATFQNIHYNLWNDVNESGMSGSMTLYDPSSITYVKHFISRVNTDGFAMSSDVHMAGYINDKTAITQIRFKISAGNIDSGVIKMFGLAKS